MSVAGYNPFDSMENQSSDNPDEMEVLAVQQKQQQLSEQYQQATDIKKQAEELDIPTNLDPERVRMASMASTGSGMELHAAQMAAADADQVVTEANGVSASVTQRQLSDTISNGANMVGASFAALSMDDFAKLGEETLGAARQSITTIANAFNNIEKSIDGSTISSAERTLMADAGRNPQFDLRPLDTPGMGPSGISQQLG